MLQNVLYILTCLSNEKSFRFEVWIYITLTHALLMSGTKYSSLKEESVRFEIVIFCHFHYNTMSRDQVNQQLKLIVETLEYVVYSNILDYN